MNITPLELLAMLWRAKQWIALFSFLAVLLAGYYAFEVATPRYLATVSMVMEVRSSPVLNFESIISGVSTDEAALNTEFGVVQSQDLMERLTIDMDLVNDPEFNKSLRPPGLISAASLRNLLVKYLPKSSESPPPTEQEKEQEQLLNTTKAVMKAITVVAQRGTYLFDIRVKSEDPLKSAAIANKHAELYIQQQLDVKFSATEYAVEWLSARVIQLERDLSEKNDAIQELRKRS